MKKLIRNCRHTMTNRELNKSVVAAALLIGAVTLASVSPLAQALQKAMYVSVVDQAGAPVPDLGPSDFIVREDDVAREVLSVVPAGEPMQVAVLVDTSDIAREQIPYLRDAVPTFVNALLSGGAGNQVAIVGFGERPTILADYTSNSDRPEEGDRSDLGESHERSLSARRDLRGFRGHHQARGAPPGHRRHRGRRPGIVLPPRRPGARPIAQRAAPSCMC